jgi:hypothetical protein
VLRHPPSARPSSTRAFTACTCGGSTLNQWQSHPLEAASLEVGSHAAGVQTAGLRPRTHAPKLPCQLPYQVEASIHCICHAARELPHEGAHLRISHLRAVIALPVIAPVLDCGGVEPSRRHTRTHIHFSSFCFQPCSRGCQLAADVPPVQAGRKETPRAPVIAVVSIEVSPFTAGIKVGWGIQGANIIPVEGWYKLDFIDVVPRNPVVWKRKHKNSCNNCFASSAT